MVKKLTIIVIFLMLFLFINPSESTSHLMANSSKVENKLNSTSEEISVKKLDKEAKILASYLSRYNSPLQYHAQDFVDAANTYNLDWKLVASIAGVESTFGKFIPGGYNGWGWGVYGTQALGFESWRDGIFTVSKGLKEDYISRGLLDPISMNKRYAASPTWGVRVDYFMKDLTKFASSYQKTQDSLPYIKSLPQIAAVSGRPVLR